MDHGSVHYILAQVNFVPGTNDSAGQDPTFLQWWNDRGKEKYQGSNSSMKKLLMLDMMMGTPPLLLRAIMNLRSLFLLEMGRIETDHRMQLNSFLHMEYEPWLTDLANVHVREYWKDQVPAGKDMLSEWKAKMLIPSLAVTNMVKANIEAETAARYVFFFSFAMKHN
jgi:hypothetical protein